MCLPWFWLQPSYIGVIADFLISSLRMVKASTPTLLLHLSLEAEGCSWKLQRLCLKAFLWHASFYAWGSPMWGRINSTGVLSSSYLTGSWCIITLTSSQLAEMTLRYALHHFPKGPQQAWAVLINLLKNLHFPVSILFPVSLSHPPAGASWGTCHRYKIHLAWSE